MTVIKLVAETKETVTLSRADFVTLVRAAEDVEDLAAIEAHRAYEDRVGWETARRNYLTVDEARRLLDGESPARVWREKRGIKQRTLAEAAEVAPSYLAEIESGKKPGSSNALQRIARVLEMPMEQLFDTGTVPPGLRPVHSADAAAERLMTLAARRAGSDRLADEAGAIVRRWRITAEQRGAKHQVKAAIETLRHRMASEFERTSAEASELERKGDEVNAARKRKAARALGAALDALVDEYNRR